jgi:membrane protein DedA with SNARE-associated domain
MSDLSQFLVAYGGPVLFGVVFVEQAGLPLPSAPWLLAAGALAAAGKLNPGLAILMTVAACVSADSLWFYVGRRGGQRVLRLFCRLSLAQNSCVGRTKSVLARHGLQGLLAAKFLPGLGAVMPPLAGALGVPTRRFILFDSLGSLLYGGFYIVAGFLFHNQLRQLLSVLDELGLSALLLAAVLLPGYIAFKYIRRRRSAALRSQPAPVANRHASLAERTATNVNVEALATAASGPLPEAIPVAFARPTSI